MKNEFKEKALVKSLLNSNLNVIELRKDLTFESDRFNFYFIKLKFNDAFVYARHRVDFAKKDFDFGIKKKIEDTISSLKYSPGFKNTFINISKVQIKNKLCFDNYKLIPVHPNAIHNIATHCLIKYNKINNFINDLENIDLSKLSENEDCYV